MHKWLKCKVLSPSGNGTNANLTKPTEKKREKSKYQVTAKNTKL